MQRLEPARLAGIAARGIRIPAYPLDEVAIGVVHFGPGAFHRVHQAYYFDELLAHDRRFGISEVSLQSSGVRDALQPQQGLYSLAVLDVESSVRVIGAARELFAARESPNAVLRRLVDPDVRLVTSTITEKGYCLRSDGTVDFSHVDIAHDIAHRESPITFVGYVVEALRQRRDLRIAPPVVISCDNLTDNGHRLRQAVIDLAKRSDSNLAAWIEGEVRFPRTMVDSITPATDEALRNRVSDALDCVDNWPVQREAFSQWVIERHDQRDPPDWQSVGVTLTAEVGGYERAKLRLLNGAHSTLAYVGSLAGIETVSQAMATPALATFVSSLMYRHIAPAVVAPAELDKHRYIESLLTRFRNPALEHRLSQIAWDGSQKLPFRLFGTIRDALASRRSVAPLCVPVAAWMHFIRRKSAAGELATDPLSKELFAIGRQCAGDAHDDVRRFLALPMFADLACDSTFLSSLVDMYRRLEGVNNKQDLGVLSSLS